MANLSRPLRRAIHILLLAAAAVCLGLHFVHLSADFPNDSPWMDWSKYTDEGWYGDAAIRHFQLGHWYVPGDFNPAAALPVLPFAEAIVFTFTGVSLVATRALTVVVFAGILIVSWFLIARHSPQKTNSLAASSAVLLLAANPFCFVFTRLAIIEPLLILLTLLALWVPHVSLLRRGRSQLPLILALGILLPLLILTKTTALFLTPAIFWMLFASTGYRIRPFLRVAAPSMAVGIALWLAYYYFAVVRPGHLLDYRYLFSANAYTGISRENFLSVLTETLRDGGWMGHILYPLALAAVVISAAVAVDSPRRLLANPLIPALVLWIAGYSAFLAYHNNLQPRYYLVIAVPLTLLVAVVAESLVFPRITVPGGRVAALTVATFALAAIVLTDARRTISFVRYPDYTLVRAAADIAAYIRYDQKADPAHNPLILSISGSDISLMTGIPSICDDFGTLELVDRVKRYKPGWYVAWNQVEDDKMDAMSPQFTLERVAEFPAMDDPDRNLLILYKLYPAGSQPPHPQHGRKPTPKRLRTQLGQQPSLEQLRH